MQALEFHQLFVQRLEHLGMSYMVTGSVAAVLYGEPRLTHDIDLVLHMVANEIEGLVQAFPLDYCAPDDLKALQRTRLGWPVAARERR